MKKTTRRARIARKKDTRQIKEMLKLSKNRKCLSVDNVLLAVHYCQMKRETAVIYTDAETTFVAENILRDSGLKYKRANASKGFRFTLYPPEQQTINEMLADLESLEMFEDEIPE